VLLVLADCVSKQGKGGNTLLFCISKQGGLHELLKKSTPPARCRSQKLVEAPPPPFCPLRGHFPRRGNLPQAPIKISDSI